ncbi:MAG: FlgD immunoglobulin-like domain containing protein [Armatimonadota bacterium]
MISRARAYVAILLAALGCSTAFAGPFTNIVNEPFATVSNGPQGAIVVNDSAMSSAAAREEAVVQAVQSQHSQQSLRRAEQSLRTLQRLGLKSPEAQVTFPRRLVHVRDGQIVAPDLMQALEMNTRLGESTNELRFTFEGFSSGDETALRDYLGRALPVAYNVYGRPAFDLDVTVRLDPDLASIQGGVYDASENEIIMAPLSGNLSEDTFVLMILVLQAFHDDAGFFYDAWEIGFAGAAAKVIQTRSGVAPGYDPITPGPFYATSVYEPQNQQALGGPTFFPESGWTGMLVWRVAMSRSAWFKCWVEDDQFFRRFNEAYYANFTEDLPGNVPALRVLASEVLPRVEGMPFQTWFQQQWVLDTSLRLGEKLFVWNVPLTRSVALIAEYYFTTIDGDEQPRGGQARTTYWSYDFAVSLFAEEGNTISIPATGDNAGEGFLIPTFFNIGGPQNITVQIDLGSLRLMLPFAYGQRGFERGENNLYGSTIGAIEGVVDVEGGAGLEDVEVDRGVWGDRITEGDLSPRQLEVSFTNENEDTVTRTINVAWDSYVVFVEGNRQETLTHSISAAGTGMHMISFPLIPLTHDLSELLDMPADGLLVARWDPQSPGDSKYSIWPRTDPIAPGRGYWIRVFSDLDFELEGVVLPEDRPAEVQLRVGWNQIGSPRLDPVDVSELEFQADGETAVGYEEAIEQRIIQPGVFGYSQDAGYTERDQLVAFEGYWIRCLNADGAIIRFPAAGTGSASVRSASNINSETLDWSLPIVAEAGEMSGAARIGAASDATEGVDRHDMQAPPGFGPRVEVTLDPEETGTAGYLRDVRPSAAPEQTYSLKIRSTLGHTPVRLRWPDMSALPEEMTPVLIDEAAGRRVYMRTSGSYELSAGDEGVHRDLKIRTRMRSSQPLIASGMSAMQTTSDTAQIVFTLSNAADVEIEVLNIAGRAVRTLSIGASDPGQNTLSWNLRDNTGSMVPGGTYLVRMKARDDTGRQTQALRPLQITR